jgi:hypothetical protein
VCLLPGVLVHYPLKLSCNLVSLDLYIFNVIIFNYRRPDLLQYRRRVELNLGEEV